MTRKLKRKLSVKWMNVPFAGPDLFYLVIGSMCWGKGADLNTAVDNCRKASCNEWHPEKNRALVYEIEASGYVSDDGCIVGNEQRKLAEII